MKRTAGRTRNDRRNVRSGKTLSKRKGRVSPVQILFNDRQDRVTIEKSFFRKIIRNFIDELENLKYCELGIQLLGDREMISINQTFLRHSGSTDVITFDHRHPESDRTIYGELFICTDEAIRQARRFKTSWQEELIRYSIHGILHLRGFDDRTPTLRRRMRIEENRVLGRLKKRFPLRKLGRALNSADD